ncbi:protocadherin Fat 4 [Crotalus adamanteus]|uniref:Protocadherin Fat 4 n=1 Tax=Crotalus adamanteus TaxID=8729 RepID=A0AAW1BA90_CROAD
MLDLIVEENIGDGSKIMQLTATDADEGANALVTYTIISGAEDSFHIDPESGELIATKRLDRERRSKYSLLVRADDGLQSSDMRINITVSDVNDHTPKFSKLWYSFDIAEDTTPGSLVAAILATDEDSGINGEITYTVSEDDGDGTFFLNPVTGVFNLTCMLDYEVQRTSLMENLPPGSTILIFNVTDADDGSNSQLTYSVTSGDSLGQFSIDKNGVLSIKQTLDQNLETLPKIILQVVARDDDQGLNSKLTYFLIYGNEDSAFTLSANGELHLVQSLDREKKKEYIMLITAIDSGIPSLTGTGTISVKVDDVNDNVPKFAFNMYSKTIPEDAPTGTDVLLVNASDSDGSVNAAISYSLSGGNSQFTINPSTGQIITSALLDREDKENYTLIIVAKDGGIPTALSSSTNVLVTIADVNDNPPKFQHHPYVTHIPSPTSTGTFVFAVTVTDADAGPNAKLHYSLSGKNSEKFHIDPARGAIMVADRLSGTSEITFTVNVNDCGLLPKTDSTTVTETSTVFANLVIQEKSVTPASTIVNAIPVSIEDRVKMEWKDTIVTVHLVFLENIVK